MDADGLITSLGLLPHPEGGFYRETYRSAAIIPAEGLDARYGGRRHVCTGILYLLREGDTSRLHRIRQDEMWHSYLGGPLRLAMLGGDAPAREVLLGSDIRAGHEVQFVVPGGVWFGATPAADAGFCLVGCTVAPGFEFEDFEMGSRASLERMFPQAKEMIREFCPE